VHAQHCAAAAAVLLHKDLIKHLDPKFTLLRLTTSG
jgi:hypothetical protein